MAFTIKDMPDLTRILLDHPEWLAEVRRLVLTDELLNLPSLVRELAAMQQRGEQRMDRVEKAIGDLTAAQQQTEQRVAELTTAQQQAEQRMERMESAITALTAAQQQTEQRVVELTAAQQQTEQRVVELTAAQQRTEQRVERIDNTLQGVQRELKEVWRELGKVRGSDLEQKYARYAAGYFGAWVRRIQLLHPDRMPPALEDRLYDQLTHAEVLDILRLDIILKGNLHPPAQRTEIYLAVEVSVTIEVHDIERAQARAALLRKAGLPAIPVVAGERLDEQADELTRNTTIVVVQNGRSWGWEQALAASQPIDGQTK